MSLVAIEAALEAGLDVISPALATARENAEFTPPGPSVPYQRLTLLPGRPDNGEISANFIQSGLFQVDLAYPAGKGRGPATARAELIRAAFHPKVSLVAQGVVVRITGTPEVLTGYVEADRYWLPVRIPFSAFIPG